ncbi:hypothetical protein KY285_009406 [Solanum tuberosum]|nr:hypothetical protein KY285_009406 [Solanum tuberosum]
MKGQYSLPSGKPKLISGLHLGSGKIWGNRWVELAELKSSRVCGPHTNFERETFWLELAAIRGLWIQGYEFLLRDNPGPVDLPLVFTMGSFHMV